MWLVGEGGIYGCGCKEVYRFNTTYPYSSCICTFFAAASPSFCSFFYVLQFDFTRKLVLLTIMFHRTDSNVRILVFVISIQGCQQFQLKYPVLIIKYPNNFFVYTLPLWYSVLLLNFVE